MTSCSEMRYPERYRVEVMRKPVRMVFPKQTIEEFLRYELRWMVQLRNIRPGG